MKTSLAVALVLSLAFPAWSRDPGLPPPPPDDENQPPPQASEMGYFERCFGVPTVGGAHIGIYGEVPIPIGHETAGIPTSPVVSSGSKDDKAWLVIAVVAVAALPVVV